MKRSACRLAAALMGAGMFFLSAANAQTEDDKNVIKQAHSAYYSMKANGLAEFQCSVSPNWNALLADARKTDPDMADRAIKTLNQIQFTVLVGSSGSAKVTHTTVTPINEEMAKGLDQVYGGMEQMVSGFFDTWTLFVINPPFPDAESVYQLADQEDHWQLSYKEKDTDVTTILDKKSVVRDLRVSTSEFTSSIQPQFTSTSQGFLLAGYQADYTGKSPSDETHLQVRITYQEVNGLQLPKDLNLGGSYGGTPFQVEVAFSGCRATKL